MPGIWQGHEREQCTKYQMVVIIMLLRNGPLVLDNLSIFGCDLPIFVIHCTRLDGFHTLSAEGGDPLGFVTSRERQSVKAMI